MPRLGRSYPAIPLAQRLGILALAQATSYTVTAPNPTGANVGVASGAFIVAIPNGTRLTPTVTMTPAATGLTFTPATVTLQGDNATATFTATPTSSGNTTITFTNNGSLANASSIFFVALAAVAGGGGSRGMMTGGRL